MDEFWMILIPQLINLMQAGIALLMLLACELVGAKVFKIELIKAVNGVEKNPLAFSVFTTGRFIGACLVLSAAWTL